MLISTRMLEEYTIAATDGEVGKVRDCFFDDHAWVVRYLVVESGSWLSSRQVLVSPYAIGEPDATNKLLPVRVSKEQVRNSPDIDTRQTVTRQHEMLYAKYYGYPYYWGGTGLWGDSLYEPILPLALSAFDATDAEEAVSDEPSPADDPHLRSAQAVSGYHIHASDGELGHVSDFLIEENTWAIRYLVVSTSNWWGGNKVLIPPQWITDISWDDRTVNLQLTREKIKAAPLFESCYELNRQQELDFYRHYERPNYWDRQGPL